MSELITRENAKQAICEVCYMFKYIGGSYTECRYYPCDDIKVLEAIPSAEAEQVTGKLKKPCDSLLTGDSDECKEQKSKLESAEAVQVVRCKDCRYKELDGEITHFYLCRINERPVDDDDFCAWGERKGGDSE